MNRALQRYWMFVAVLAMSLLSVGTQAAAPEGNSDARPYLLHLPGIAGETWADRNLLRGLASGGLDADFRIYDWTGDDPGIPALLARKRNRTESEKIAELILQVRREAPDRPIFLSAHSGGTGLAVWALENLPDDILIDGVLLMAPAISPQYDLTRALRHVRTQMYVFSSPLDVAILGAGTKVFGTIDGVKCDAAGLVGFTRPESADPSEYDKLVAKPYDAEWMRLGNIGDHIGPLNRKFAERYLAPLIQAQLAAMVALPTPSTQPVDATP